MLPPLDELQRDPATRDAWIEYSTYDAEATWKLRAALEAKLRAMHWIGGDSLWDFYNIYLVPFAECLTDLERAGIHVDKRLLHEAEVLATRHRAEAEAKFLAWAAALCPGAEKMNVGSDVQKAHLLFAPCARKRGARHRYSAAAPVSPPPPPPPPPAAAAAASVPRPAARAAPLPATPAACRMPAAALTTCTDTTLAPRTSTSPSARFSSLSSMPPPAFFTRTVRYSSASPSTMFMWRSKAMKVPSMTRLGLARDACGRASVERERAGRGSDARGTAHGEVTHSCWMVTRSRAFM